MKKIFLLLFTLFCVVGANAQVDTLVGEKPEEQHDERMPEYPGGQDSMQKFIVKNVVYPQKALKEKIQGKVYVSFEVEKDGSLSDICVISKEVGGGLEEEAIRVVKLFPKFTPGTLDGNPVKVMMTVPFKFKLDQ